MRVALISLYYNVNMKSIVVAYDRNYGIGADNDMLWQRDMPSDLRHFRELTLGQAVIMGRKTFESIGYPLPKRQNIVISRHSFAIEGIEVVRDVEEAYAAVEPGSAPFIIGGSEIYRLAYPSVDRIYATLVHAVFEDATVFFPEPDLNTWDETAREDHLADNENKYDYSFITYQRKDS